MKPGKTRTEKQIEQFKRFQVKGTLTAMRGQAIRLLNEGVFSPESHFRLRMIQRNCNQLLEILEER